MNILLLHHFETIWSEGLSKYNTDFESQQNIYMDYILSNKDTLDKVIITRFEGVDLEPEHQSISDLCDRLNINIECIEYAYGWVKEQNPKFFSKKNENKTWCYGTRDYHDGKNDVLIIDEWMHNLKNDTIYLGGAFENECVDDVNTALKAANVEVVKCDDLIVGTYERYTFKTKIENIGDFVGECIDLEEAYLEFKEEYDLENLSEDEFNEIKKELLDFENRLNETVYNNLSLINLFNLEDEILDNINDSDFKDMVDNIISNEDKFESFSILSDKFDIEKIKNKLNSKEVAPLKKTKLKM